MMTTTAPHSSPKVEEQEAPGSLMLADQFGRVFDYLRIAVTDHCNLRCIYCMPEDGIDFAANEQILSTEEIVRVITVASRLGVSKIRYTGGEPLLRRDMLELISGTARVPGIESIHMTTNGLLLTGQAKALRQAGLDGVNISLDTLDAAKYLRITRRAGVERALAGMRAALEAGFPSVKINVVAMRGFNDDELGEFAALTQAEPITVRFIELMPFDAHQIWKTGRYFGVDMIRERLLELFPRLEDTSGSATEGMIFQVPGYAGKIALIPAYTRSICATCNRVRLTADGQIRNCLYSTEEFDLRAALRRSIADEEIARLMQKAMWLKPEDGWVAQHRDGQLKGRHGRESMTQIGG